MELLVLMNFFNYTIYWKFFISFPNYSLRISNLLWFINFFLKFKIFIPIYLYLSHLTNFFFFFCKKLREVDDDQIKKENQRNKHLDSLSSIHKLTNAWSTSWCIFLPLSPWNRWTMNWKNKTNYLRLLLV